MNNEDTILDTQSFPESNPNKSNAPESGSTSTENTTQNETATTSKKKGSADKSAYAAGGFVAGVASTAAVETMAGNKNTEEIPEEIEEEPTVDPADSPAEQDAIVATDEGIRVAQVDDDKSFSEAFADARAQVGPGGVFEWRGKVYGTFYKDEWDSMSPEERSEWQSRIDYDDVRDQSESNHYTSHEDSPQYAQTQGTHQTAYHEDSYVGEPELNVVDVEYVDVDGDGRADTVVELDNGLHLVDTNMDGEADIAMADLNGSGQLDEGEYAYISDEHIAMPVDTPRQTANTQQVDDSDVEVHVIDVGQADLNGDGYVENVAVVEVDGHEALLVDIDQDNVAEVIISDLNGDGQLQDNEIADISDAGLEMPEMSDGDIYMTQADSAPDYMNDADTGMYEV